MKSQWHDPWEGVSQREDFGREAFRLAGWTCCLIVAMFVLLGFVFDRTAGKVLHGLNSHARYLKQKIAKGDFRR